MKTFHLRIYHSPLSKGQAVLLEEHLIQAENRELSRGKAEEIVAEVLTSRIWVRIEEKS